MNDQNKYEWQRSLSQSRMADYFQRYNRMNQHGHHERWTTVLAAVLAMTCAGLFVALVILALGVALHVIR